jgi:hypothetical protein
VTEFEEQAVLELIQETAENAVLDEQQLQL